MDCRSERYLGTDVFVAGLLPRDGHGPLYQLLKLMFSTEVLNFSRLDNGGSALNVWVYVIRLVQLNIHYQLSAESLLISRLRLRLRSWNLYHGMYIYFQLSTSANCTTRWMRAEVGDGSWRCWWNLIFWMIVILSLLLLWGIHLTAC